jgi:uncharacterized protein YbbK (DUF523 family)
VYITELLIEIHKQLLSRFSKVLVQLSFRAVAERRRRTRRLDEVNLAKPVSMRFLARSFAPLRMTIPIFCHKTFDHLLNQHCGGDGGSVISSFFLTLNRSPMAMTTGVDHLPTREQILALPDFTPDEPMRILMSGCLAGILCGYDGTNCGEYPQPALLIRLPNVRVTTFCPEDFSFGTPRALCNIHGGDGFDVLDGKARVLTESGEDWTEGMVAAARRMLEVAREEQVHLSLLLDISAAC